jgi:alkaline phosphatase D
VERPGAYPLYDITVSPLTSGTHKFFGPEANNPYRVFGLDEKQNYARFHFSGKKDERKLTVQFIGLKGEKLGTWSVMENEIKNK